MLQVQSSSGTALANVVDVSVEIKTSSADSAQMTVTQMTSLLQDYTAMSVSNDPFFPDRFVHLMLILQEERSTLESF